MNDEADRHQAEVDRQVALEQPVAEEASQASVPLPLQRTRWIIMMMYKVVILI